SGSNSHWRQAMTCRPGIALLLLASTASIHADDRQPIDARVRFAVDLGAVKITLKSGRTLVYTTERSDPVKDVRPIGSASTTRQFTEQDMNRLVQTLRTGDLPTTLKLTPVTEGAAGSRLWITPRSDGFTVELGMFDHELRIEFHWLRIARPAR